MPTSDMYQAISGWYMMKTNMATGSFFKDQCFLDPNHMDTLSNNLTKWNWLH